MSSPISTPKGGGAQSGLGEKFSPDLFTGTGNFSVPIALPPGRNGFQPELGLQYSTGSGNSPFGLGWNMSVPGVMRKTAKGVPRYDDEKDTFILSGAEDLVAVRKIEIRDNQQNEAGILVLQNERGFATQYRPRTEGLFARIYHLKTNFRNCWKVMSKDGLVSWYGSKELFEGDLSLVQKPDHTTSVFAWKLTFTEDTFGNHIRYTYEKEQVRENDYHRWDQNYLKEIKYSDYSLSPFGGQGLAYMVRVLFTYENRSDAFSDYKSGFDIRTTKRCKDIQIFTNPTSGEIKTRTYHFQYSDEVLPANELPYNGASLLCKMEVQGHDGTASEYLPPLEFRYTHFKPAQQKFKKLEGGQMPLASLASPGFELIDLFGNGLPDIVEINGVVRYWRNLGNGKFDSPRTMKEAPAGITLASADVQLIDANGDGRTDLLVNGTQMSGYYSMKHNASWDTKSFKKYRQAPSFSFADPEVKLMDLTGDGVTDVLRNGSAFECFFQDKNDGWTETRRVAKKQIDEFPNVSFADPRIKLADMTGDGLQDIVQVHSGSIRYWPNLGYGNFGKPITMKNSPRFPMVFDPARVLLGDIDGDGQADLIFIDAQKITFWINKSGNGWSEPIEITGTPFVPNVNGIRIADIHGSGVSGVLYSFDAMTSSMRHQWYFLDLTGGTKPYLLHEMDNNMGALTRVSYLPSTRYYLKDQYGLSDEVLEAAPPELSNPSQLTVPYPTGIWKHNFKKRSPWKTTLPFPVQVVSKVEVIDQISFGKLVTRYIYHHGYWDGGEREFRGFGRVDQKDTETFQRFNAAIAPPSFRINAQFNSSFVSNDGRELVFQQTGFEHYSPPVEMRNWFHLGPVGDEFGDWEEVNFKDEYWQDDLNVLQREPETINLIKSLPRRAKRDAFRAWRGGSLRTELYALDEQANGEYKPGAGGKPYTVTESQYGIRLEAAPSNSNLGEELNSPFGSDVLFVPKETSGYVFFSFSVGNRSTQWERGNDTKTNFTFSGDYNEYGQPLKSLTIALPRGIQPPYTSGTGTSPVEEGNKILSTVSVTSYALKDNEETFIVDRACKAASYEVIQQQNENVFDLKIRVFNAELPTETGNTIYPLIAFSLNYYDAPTAFGDGLPLGALGKHGALARTETLIATDEILIAAYGSKPEFFKFSPETQDFSAYPTDFISALQNGDTNLGYKKHNHSDDVNYATGYYTESGRTKYDWQISNDGKGLVLETKDVFENLATIEYDDYKLLPVTAKQWLNVTDFLSTNAEYDYRVLQAKKITDPNGNRSVFGFSALGLLKQSGVIGKLNADEGDIISEVPLLYEPSVRMEYDFLAFYNSQQPVWVKTIQREKHWQDDPDENSPTIIKVEYTDGFGRLLQTRTQAEDVIFGNSTFGDSGLPEIQTENADAVGVQRSPNALLNVVVSGWQVYNNKGKVVLKYEPFFSKGFDFVAPEVEPEGVKVRMFYDPRGNVIRTVNPDNTEQWVVFGKPDDITTVRADGTNHWKFTNYNPSPWESFSYDANDLAPLTHPSGSGVPAQHNFTPKSSILDALGRTVKTIERNGANVNDEVVMKYEYDIRGNLLKVKDAYDRLVFNHVYDLRPKQKNDKGEEQPLTPLKTFHIDKGISNLISDATGKQVETDDAKGAQVLSVYDTLSRPVRIYAKDKTAENITLRQKLIYGDDVTDGPASPETTNHLGKLYKHFDEAGLLTFDEYDFKGNVLEKKREVIADSEILDVFSGPPTDWAVECFRVDWDNAPTLEGEYFTTTEYDALNRVTKLIYPEDLETERKELLPVYNNAGALEKVSLDGETYVEHIAYNAKGQRLLIAFGNDTMTRYCYDANTFRLTRQRSEGYTKTSWTFETAGTVHQDTGYEYDLAGNIIKIKEHTTGCGVGATNSLDRTFNYDPLYRLLQATGRENSPTITPIWDDSYRSNDNSITTFYTQNYQYDKLGNIQQLQHIGNNSFTRNFNYNSNHNKLESIDVGMDNYAFTYDENGNQITENTERHFEWDAADKMRCFFNQAGTAQPSVYSHYLYDASGNRLKKLTRKDSGDKEITIYIDGIFEYRYNIDGSNTLIEEQNVLHVMDDKSRIATKRVGDQFSDDIDSDVIYNLEDHLGSSTVHIGNVGDFISKEEYYPFGETSFGSYAKKRYKYCAKERDNESGLYYYGARYYAAWTCRFVSVDPLAKDYTNLTAYNYAGNKPINYFDIDGMQSSGGDTPTSNNTTPENNNLPTPENKENVINTSSIDNANFTNNIPDNSKQKLASAIYDKIQNLIGLPITSGKEVRLSKETIESHLIKDTTKKDTYFLVLSEDNIFSLSLNKGEIKEEIKEGFTEAIKEPFEKVGEWAAKKLVGKELVEAFKFVSKKANVLTDILDIINKSPVYDEQAIIQMTEIGLERYFIPKDKPIELEPLSPFVPDNTGIGVGFGNFGLQ